MLEYKFGMIETLMIAVVLLLLGKWVKKRVNFFEKYFIPAPVIGGVIFSIVTLIGYQTKAFNFSFDGTLKDLLMVAFFTTIGFTASLSLLKKGGVQVALFLAVASGLIALQNAVGIALAKFFGLNPLLGIAVGSVPLTGGHGTSGAFGPVLEAAGASGAFSVSIASATFGLVAGCMIGGPVGKLLLAKTGVKANKFEEEYNKIEDSADTTSKINEASLFNGLVCIIISMGIGVMLNPLVKSAGITLPVYIMPMIVAAVIRNIADGMKLTLPMEEIAIIGNISLSLFLAMALMTLKLWELAALAIPLIVMLAVQTFVMATYAYFVTFNVMGRDYDAAVMACGHCGFGMGASPNAMANMETFTTRNGASARAFFVVPLVGALFIDFTNAAIITFFISMFK
jgi:ESS family glutamate:Na+ symporter